jgi:hypothetical protein
VLAVGARLILLALASADGAATPSATLPIASGRTTTLVVGADVGAPIERAVPSATYAHAAAADADERWEDAPPLYRKAIDEWTAATRSRSSRAVELAIDKAEHEARASQALAADARHPARPGRAGGDPGRTFERRQALETGRLLAAKLLATRAWLGRVSATLYTHARDRLETARGEPTAVSPPAADIQAEAELLLCVTYAVGGAATEARLARARVSEAARDDPGNTLAVAACAAALGDTETALGLLETFVLRPAPPRADRFLRDIYLRNDWDRLRGNPRFESLFR